MNHETVNGADFYDFEHQNEKSDLLWFMGPDYLAFISNSIEGLLSKQLESPEILGVRSTGQPQFQTRVAKNRDNKVSYVEIDWPMQILFKDSEGHLRLDVEMNYKYWAHLDGSEKPRNEAAVNVISQERLKNITRLSKIARKITRAGRSLRSRLL